MTAHAPIEPGQSRRNTGRSEAGQRRRNTRRSEGNAVMGLAALLTILICAGGMNYVRNLRVDQASEKTRPFHTYDKEDLQALKGAYEAEVAQGEARYASHRAARQRANGREMMDEAVADFDRVVAHTAGLRELGAEVAESEARVREIDQELAFRAQIGEGWEAHMRRLTRF